MKKQQGSQTVDIIGIGIGAFNLSLAALLTKTSLKYQFFDQKKRFHWHRGMLLKNAQLQVHFLKDLASCVDPANPYTFLAYLVEKGRIYSFLNRKKNTVSRHEFNDYFQWASQHIPDLYFDEKVLHVEYKNALFHIVTTTQQIQSKHLAIGTGISPYVPTICEPFIGEPHFFHNYQSKQRIDSLDLVHKRIAVIGGGQSGAEIFDTLISQSTKPDNILWVSKRLNFQSLEDSCFANELYTPNYVEYFYQLPEPIRQKKLEEQRLTSDGITQDFSDAIYNKLYELKYIQKTPTIFDLAPNHTLTQVEKIDSHYLLTLHDHDNNQQTQYLVDVVILATGYQSLVPSCVNALLPGHENTDSLTIAQDYSIKWTYADTNKIFIQNGAKHTHGVSDPNLSLAAWRNSIIINSLMKSVFYKTTMAEPLLTKKTCHSVIKGFFTSSLTIKAPHDESLFSLL